MSRSRVLVVVIAILLSLAGGWYWIHLHNASQTANPVTVELPVGNGAAGATKTYLGGPGAPIVRLYQATKVLPSQPTMADCREVGARLDAIGKPGGLEQLAAGIPDSGVRDASMNHVAAVLDYLRTCGAGDLAAASERAQFTAVVLQRLFAREGVTS